ncbi:MAG: alkyl hydroperoxide reductase [Herpetosiphonaceae bacterium]|nr:MAG: alkyl hydroperoxide reductase [Herpetosiphonaceae bacterium]
MPDYYELLGVTRGADQAAIEEAYQRRRAEYAADQLPDIAPEIRSLAQQRQETLDEAYRILSDPTLRSSYDAGMEQQRRPLLTKRELLWSLGGALVALLLLVGLWNITSGQQPLPPLIAVEKPAPHFDLPTLDGKRVRLDQFRGKVVLINFWATWCGPCIEEAPALADAYRRLRDQGLVIIGIDLRDQESSDEEVAAFVQRYGVDYPVVLDRDGSVARAYQIYPIPVSYFVDANGTIRYIRNGILTAQEIERTFQELKTLSAEEQSIQR